MSYFRFTGPGAWSTPVDEAVRDPRPVFLNALPDGFTGHRQLVGEIDSFLAEQPSGYLWIEGDAGTGKTALATYLARERGWISHFGGRADGGSVRVALCDLAAQLIVRGELWTLVPGRLLPEWAGTPGGFEALLTRVAGSEPLVLLVDGADRAVTPEGRQPWGLPDVLPPNVFVVGTYRTGSAPPRCDAVIRMDDRNVAALRSYHAGQLDQWRDDDVALPVLSTLAVAREALPLATLSHLSGVDEDAVREWCDLRLRPFLTAGTTTFEIYDTGLREMWSELLGPAAVEAHGRIADHCLAHLSDDYSLRYLGSHLLAARRLTDLEALLREEKDGELVWFAAHHAAGTLDVYAETVAVVREHYERLTDEALRRGRLAPVLVGELHYQLISASLKSLTPTIPPRVLEVAAETGVWAWQRVLAHVRHLPDPADQVAAMTLVAPHLPEKERPDVVARALALVDTWDEPARWQAVGALAPHLSEEQLTRYFRLVIARCDKESGLTAFCRLAPHLHAAGIDRALAVAKWLDHQGEPGPLAALAPHQPADGPSTSVTEDATAQPSLTLDAIAALRSESERADALAEVAGTLTPDEFARALRIAEAITDGADRGRALAELAATLPDPETRASLTASALTAATGIAGKVIWTKTALAAQLPAPARDTVVDELLATAGATRNEHLVLPVVRLLTDDQWARHLSIGGAWAMEHVALHGPAGLLSSVLDEISTWNGLFLAQTIEKIAHRLSPAEARRLATIAAAFDDAQARGRALCALGPHLPADEQRAAATTALAALTENPAPPEFYLAELLPQLSLGQLEEVLALTRDLTEQRRGAQLLRGLALTLPADRMPDVRALVGKLTTEPDRGSVLNAVLSRLPVDQQTLLCEEEVEAATTNKYPYTILMWLAAYLPHHLHARALAIVRARGPLDEAGTGVLRDLAPHLSNADLEDAVALARTAKHDSTRVKALAHLLPQLQERRRAEIFDEALTPDLPLDLVSHLSAGELARACDVLYLPRDTVAKALLARAAELGEHLLYARILRTVWQVNDRSGSLAVLKDGLPVLRDLAGLEFGPLFLESLDDVHRWWP
ncbi:hypothetical protein SK803_28540 [Lentzea sp. BCCO 10_0856]|uniref:ATP-binding protein n=1 Tax=Lentzea miocenica TaxID=3095431 RepID=A0ABU4T7P3_9PSEU|nr:hypothetical protein [Lentzea sp. BCCO 10_0856]MDX8034186.1 hypothetical protein [Lentzea sp. BCCO 10_0856]